MRNREVTITVCGLVAGVMLAGSILAQGGVPMQGSLTDLALMRSGPRQLEQSRARVIKRKNLTATPEENEAAKYPSITDDGVEGGLEPAAKVQEQEIDPAVCAITKEIVGEVRDAHDLAVPRSLRNNEARKILNDILDGVIEQRCGTDAVEAKTQRIQKRNNRCTRFPEASARFVECKKLESEGVSY